MSEKSTVSIHITNNISVTVPAQLNYLTTFVLYEQNDWFEDEIKFIRNYIKPGMKVIDIGANYGLYALNIAKIIGPTGKLWAFEPTNGTATCLKNSINENKFNNVDLIQAGLSNNIGEAKLFISRNSELNSLTQTDSSGGECENIRLLTLDHCQQEYQWQDIDFVKLDAEGEEDNILIGGEHFLSLMSPLIMYELKHGSKLNLPLIEHFEKLGYKSYRLLPKLNILIEFNKNEPVDEYLLNLFCCKDDRAEILESEGVIVRNWEEKISSDTNLAKEHIADLPYFNILSNIDEPDIEYQNILSGYLMSLSESLENDKKVAYLMGALGQVRNKLNNGERRFTHLVTFSRIAFDCGERALGMSILQHLITSLPDSNNLNINDLFLPADERYDLINPGENIHDWLLSSILEKYVEKHAFSTYFSGKKVLPYLEKINNLGFVGADMTRRFNLMKQCFSS